MLLEQIDLLLPADGKIRNLRVLNNEVKSAATVATAACELGSAEVLHREGLQLSWRLRRFLQLCQLLWSCISEVLIYMYVFIVICQA